MIFRPGGISATVPTEPLTYLAVFWKASLQAPNNGISQACQTSLVQYELQIMQVGIPTQLEHSGDKHLAMVIQAIKVANGSCMILMLHGRPLFTEILQRYSLHPIPFIISCG